MVVGADRIAANGDVANKIGTYSLAVLAHHHGVPFYVAAPTSTIDPATPDGAVDRDRASATPTRCAASAARRSRRPGVAVENRAFDVTPAALVTGYVTERGVAGRRPTLPS